MNDDLRWNKIFGAILGTALLILLLRQGSEMLFTTKPPAKVGYTIAVQLEGDSGGETADVPPDWGTVLPTADVAAGAVVANKCKSCHNFDNGGPNQTGPNLWGVLGRKPGSHPGFAYSSGMTDLGAKLAAWDYAHVYDFLKGPQAYVSGTKMSFVGLKKREDRINLIGWLRQQNSSPPAIPAPNPAAAAAAQAPAGAPGSAPEPNAATTVPDQAGAAAGAPAAAAPGAPADAGSGGQAPTSGAAAAPTAVIASPGGNGPSGGASAASRKPPK